VALKNASGWGAPGTDKAAKARAFRGWGAWAGDGVSTGVRTAGNKAIGGAKVKGVGGDMPT
jgi:hypothetical protein